ncbi:hypothetical protein KY348_00160 [Candidatus Woesearchaeota archaeon]|nr:hypothetical protein [Candidatus Woesearchaeota archaeon]
MILDVLRIFFRRIKVLFRVIIRYGGDDKDICEQIISDCYNQKKKYFMVSKYNFSEFYARDFGWCAQALLNLGYRKEIINTLDYVLGVFQQHGRIEQSVSPRGIAFTFPMNKYSPDALAFIIRALRLSRAKELINKYKRFLNQEIRKYYELVVDNETGLVKKDKSFSSMKDYSIRKSSCYDNVMTGMLANDLKKIKDLANPFKKHDYKKLLIKNFWTGKYFLDDLSNIRAITGDANVLPFWSGLITDKKIRRKAFDSIRKEGLDKPFPLKYTVKRLKEQKMISIEFIAGNYERDVVWAHMGMMFIEMVGMIDKKLARKYLNQYKQQILKHKNFLEVYDKNGKPFQTLLYYADGGMLWCANYLYLRKKLL